MVLTRDKRVFAVGSNTSGALGLGHTYSSDTYLQVHGLSEIGVKQISAGRHSAAISDDGRLFVWGLVFEDQEPLLLPQELKSNKKMTSISIGQTFSTLIDDEGHLYSWGISNSLGQLGRHYDPQLKVPQFVDSLVGKVVTRVAVGKDFGFALGQDFSEDGSVLGPHVV